jgi:CubicO group peptidase (beta-lactamase class C family)
VLAEVLTRVAQQDYREFFRERIALPLGLPTLRIGVPRDEQGGIANIIGVGEPLSSEEIFALTGGRLTAIDRGEVTIDNLLHFNLPEVRELGVPGAGSIMTAADLALFYQALLHNPGKLWDPDVLADGTAHVRVMMPDFVLGTPAFRTLGITIAGDETRSFRGYGKTNSPRAFGHGGAFGQVGWADPETGLSFAYFSNGLDDNFIRETKRGIALGSLAAVCAA